MLIRCLFDVADQVLNQPRKYAFIQDRAAANNISTYVLQVRVLSGEGRGPHQ